MAPERTSDRRGRTPVSSIRYLCPFLILLASFQGCGGGEPDGPDRITVMTYNLFYLVRDPASAVAAIREGAADMVFLQEATREWESCLRKALASRYPHIGFKYDPHGAGIGVLSKYPFEDGAFTRATVGWFSGRVVRVRTGSGEIQVLAVHLKPVLWDRKGFSLKSILNYRSDHRAEIEHLYHHVRDGIPTFVVGDFNENVRGSAVRWLIEEKGLADTLSRFDRKAPTWHMDIGWMKLGAQLDHILHSRHFACTSARVIRAPGSDHYPVVGTFEWQDR